MKRTLMITIVVVTCVTTPLAIFAEKRPEEGRETLSRALRGAWLPLESGLTLSAREGTPLSAKYEIEDGGFQLSVYTLKTHGVSGDSYVEVIVDYSTGVVAKVVAITDGGDLSAAHAQRTALALAKRSLAEATEAALGRMPATAPSA